MGKLLLWVALVALGWLALKLVAASQRRRQAGRRVPPAGGGGAPGELASEMMVQCAHCGEYLPASDALADGDRHFCNRAHRDAERAGQPRE